MTVVRIIARRVWPSVKQQSVRSSLRLRWDALTEDGELLVAATEHPLAQGARALIARGLDPDTLVTMRHEGSAHDSFRPHPARVAAAPADRRAESIAVFRATLRQRSASTGFYDPAPTPDEEGDFCGVNQ